MRKEIESLKDLRSVMARRLSSVDAAGSFDLCLEMQVAAAMALRLMDAGILQEADWVLGEDAHKPDIDGGMDAAMVRIKLKVIFVERIRFIQPAMTQVEVSSTDQFIDDLTGFVIEVAAYRRAYVTLCERVAESNTRYQKLRVPPSQDRSDRLDRKSYRQDDPAVVLEESLKAAADARLRISWARGRLSRLKKIEVDPVPTEKKGRGRPRLTKVSGPDASSPYRSVRGFFRLFQEASVEKRLAKLRRAPGLLVESALRHCQRSRFSISGAYF